MNPDDYRLIAVFRDRLFSPVLRRLREDIRTYVTYKGYRKIIDIGCGSGQQLALLERPGMILCGIDTSPARLARAESHCPGDMEILLSDGGRDVSTAGSFDCAIISFALHEIHPTCRRTIYDRSRKCVRQGGALIIADYTAAPGTVAGFFFGRIIIPLIERCAGAGHYHNYTAWMKAGGLEGFLARRRVVSDIISRPLGETMLCCTLPIDEARSSASREFALLERALAPARQPEP